MTTLLRLSSLSVALSFSALACGNGETPGAATGTTGASGTAVTTGAGGASTAAATGAGGASTSGGTPTSSGASTSSSAAGTGGGGMVGEGESVLQRNKHSSRDGAYVQPTLTKAKAGMMALDPSFKAAFDGNVYAQPLYVENGPGGKGIFLAVTESNSVYALDETTGAIVWKRTVGTPAGQTGAGCGNIAGSNATLGITGTPYIDLPSRTMYFSAVIGTAATITKHEIHAVSIDDGTEKAGFPFDTTTVSAGGKTFNPVVENQRSALSAVGKTLYVPYGGHWGDCGDYRGWVIALPFGSPTVAGAFISMARGGGIWAPGGLASDGTDIFGATGNTFGANTWSQGEAIIRIKADASFTVKDSDYFTPSDWKALDAGDVDLGGSGPVVIDVPGATPSALVVALGKNGVAYLLDRKNLGGIGKGNGSTGEGLASAKVAKGAIINTAAAYTTASGVYVVLHVHNGGQGVGCPNGTSGDLIALKIGASSPPTLSVAWCADNQGQGSPIATTTDGKSEAIVWSAGAEGSKRLHAFDGDTGASLFDGGSASDVMANNIRRFNSPIAVKGRIIVAADKALYAFKTP